ncbi:MAG: YgjV family protein [Burkholderiales bacterium]|nr:YgjV family protein [Burkholderiales bacterium]
MSPAQGLGYLAFVFGVGCFLQRDDRRFKVFMALECLAYVLHFALLGQATAVASALVSLARSVVALRTQSPWAAAGFVGLNIALGAWLFQGWASLLPLAASCIGTVALFLLQGLRMRLLMLLGTLLWVANNLIVGSIGGTALELVVATVNAFTIWRLWRAAPATPTRVGG